MPFFSLPSAHFRHKYAGLLHTTLQNRNAESENRRHDSTLAKSPNVGLATSSHLRDGHICHTTIVLRQIIKQSSSELCLTNGYFAMARYCTLLVTLLVYSHT